MFPVEEDVRTSTAKRSERKKAYCYECKEVMEFKGTWTGKKINTTLYQCPKCKNVETDWETVT